MIPDFDLSGVLPPFMGPNPGIPATRSPYGASIVEFIDRFATTGPRRSILLGLLKYREALHNAGISDGFQWLCGSFLEDIEQQEGRPPRDLDVVTFLRRPAGHEAHPDWIKFVSEHLELFIPDQLKSAYGCDAYPVDLSLGSEAIIPQATYWFGLFSHQRSTFQWKGFLRVPLYDAQDVVALDHLNRASNT